MILYVIRSVSDPTLFWSNEWGWGTLKGSTIFTSDERYNNHLPIDGEWLQTEPDWSV